MANKKRRVPRGQGVRRMAAVGGRSAASRPRFMNRRTNALSGKGIGMMSY